jgi:hypothetical protein
MVSHSSVVGTGRLSEKQRRLRKPWEPVEALLRVFEFAGGLKYTAPYGFAAAAPAV